MRPAVDGVVCGDCDGTAELRAEAYAWRSLAERLYSALNGWPLAAEAHHDLIVSAHLALSEAHRGDS
jgi:hypothetical protein